VAVAADFESQSRLGGAVAAGSCGSPRVLELGCAASIGDVIKDAVCGVVLSLLLLQAML
jgi:hypothetical protein